MYKLSIEQNGNSILCTRIDDKNIRVENGRYILDENVYLSIVYDPIIDFVPDKNTKAILIFGSRGEENYKEMYCWDFDVNTLSFSEAN